MTHGETGQWEALVVNRKKGGEREAGHYSASCSQQKKNSELSYDSSAYSSCLCSVYFLFLPLLSEELIKNLSLLRLCVIACLVLSQPFHIYKETQYYQLSFFTAFSSWHIAPEEKKIS